MAGNSVFDTVVGWAGLVGTALTVVTVALALVVTTSGYQRRALLRRRRSVLRPALTAGAPAEPVSRRAFDRAAGRLLHDRVGRGRPTVRQELEFLSSLVGATATEPWQTGRAESPAVPVPFTFASSWTGPDYGSRLATLAAAYEAYAVSVRRRWVLRSSAGPLVAEEYDVAQSTALLLRRLSTYQPTPIPPGESVLRDTWVELGQREDARGQARDCRVQLITWPLITSARASITFPALAVSFQPMRVVADGAPAHDSALIQALATIVVPGDPSRGTTDPSSYDGVLSRWHGDGFRLETDRVSGRQQLHLCLSETSYFAFAATQHPRAGSPTAEQVDGSESRLLSLTLLCMDDDEKVLLVQRSSHVIYPGRYATTVSGNCELAPREGINEDLDERGLPDLLAAISREADEELGLKLTAPNDHLSTLGVIRIVTESEVGTRIVVFTARLPGSADTYRLERSSVDPVEGAWELGEGALVVDMRAATSDAVSAKRFVRWLRTSPDLTAHASGSFLLLMIARQQLAERRHQRSAGSPAGAQAPDWTVDDLATWLAEPPSGIDPGELGFLQERPLWT